MPAVRYPSVPEPQQRPLGKMAKRRVLILLMLYIQYTIMSFENVMLNIQEPATARLEHLAITKSYCCGYMLILQKC